MKKTTKHSTVKTPKAQAHDAAKAEKPAEKKPRAKRMPRVRVMLDAERRKVLDAMAQESGLPMGSILIQTFDYFVAHKATLKPAEKPAEKPAPKPKAEKKAVEKAVKLAKPPKNEAKPLGKAKHNSASTAKVA